MVLPTNLWFQIWQNIFLAGTEVLVNRWALRCLELVSLHVTYLMMFTTKSYLQFLKLSNNGNITIRLCTPNQHGHWSPEFAILLNNQDPHTLASTIFQIPLWFHSTL